MTAYEAVIERILRHPRLGVTRALSPCLFCWNIWKGCEFGEKEADGG